MFVYFAKKANNKIAQICYVLPVLNLRSSSNICKISQQQHNLNLLSASGHREPGQNRARTGPERGPGAGQGQRRHARRARVELGALAAAILVAIIGEDLVIGAVQELGELWQRLGDNLTRPHRSATQEAGHQVGVAGRGVTLKYVPFNITTDFCK